MEDKEKPKQLEFNGKKVRFYYQDLVAYTDDFLREIIWYQKEKIEELGKLLNLNTKEFSKGVKE